MLEEIEDILKIAVNAPSGHNSQPWKFIFKDGSLFIYNLPDKDKTLFNWQQRGSLVAHGALIENIRILASEKGLDAKISIFPSEKESDLIAKIDFLEKETDYYKDLQKFVSKRTTNRRPFNLVSIKKEDEEKLEKFIKSIETEKYKIYLTQDREVINKVVGSFSMGDRLLFENFHIHKGLFDHVNWNLKEELERREGLYVMTKELTLPERMVFKHLLSKWNTIKKLEKINFSTKAAEKRVKLYKQCSAIGVISSTDDSSKSFVEAGMILERFWIFVNSLGLSFQPMSVGLLYLGQKCEVEKVEELTDNQINFINESYKKILNTLELKNRTPIFSFRIGYSKQPTASSVKKEPVVINEG